VEIYRLFLLWWRDCTCYGGDVLAIPVMVEINRLYLLWWKFTDWSSYGGDKQTICYGGDLQAVPLMVEINKLYDLWWRFRLLVMVKICGPVLLW
jgi:hypothetical protein